MKKHMKKIGKGFDKGKNVIIMENVSIGDNVRLGNNVIIYPDVKIGNGVKILNNSIIGIKPETRKKSVNKTKNVNETVIGNNVFIGNNSVIYAGVNIGIDSFLSDLVWIRENTILGNENIIGTNALIMNAVRIGNHSRVSINSQIAEFTEIGQDVFIGPNISTSADNSFGRAGHSYMKTPIKIKDKARLGANCIILQGVEIGYNSIIGAGSVVMRSIPDNVLAMGNPARVIKSAT